MRSSWDDRFKTYTVFEGEEVFAGGDVGLTLDDLDAVLNGGEIIGR